MDIEKAEPDFFTLNDLVQFNNKVEYNVLNESANELGNKTDNVSVEFDPNTFKSFLVNPLDLDNSLLIALADIIDKKNTLDTPDNDVNSDKGPNTTDKIMKSIAVAYIMDGDVPVGVATLVDPTKENYKGIIPLDFYSLKAAVNLENRIQQEFFSVRDEYRDMGIAGELRRLLETVTNAMFVAVDASDTDTIDGLKHNGYVYVNQFETDWNDSPVQLWVN